MQGTSHASVRRMSGHVERNHMAKAENATFRVGKRLANVFAVNYRWGGQWQDGDHT